MRKRLPKAIKHSGNCQIHNLGKCNCRWKIIDERGMLFGKINIIDLLVIIFILLISPIFYWGYKIYNKKSLSPQVNWEQKYNEEIYKRERFCKEHKGASICK